MYVGTFFFYWIWRKRYCLILQNFLTAEHKKKEKYYYLSSLFVTGDDLLSRVVSNQVPSALKGLTSVFGMRTGGSPSPLSPEWLNVLLAHSQLHSKVQVSFQSIFFLFSWPVYSLSRLRTSLRPISIGKLNALLRLHTRPINLVVFKGSYTIKVGYLILRWVSRLDAFSVYPIQTSLPSCATGVTTGAQ